MKNNLKNKWIWFPIVFVSIMWVFIFVFGNDKKLPIITDIYYRSFNDTVLNVYSQKYNETVIALTILKNKDSMLRLNGTNEDSNHYFIGSFGNEDPKFWDAPHISILYKKNNSDSFYLKRDGKIIGYKISH